MFAALVTLLTVFSDKIVGRVRLALNRADLRTKYFEQLATDLSTFAFYADLFYTRYVRGESNSADLEQIKGEVNGAYVTLKTNEYVYRSWVRRYWKEEKLQSFLELMSVSRLVYEAIIEFNQKNQMNAKIETLGNRLSELTSRAESWLSSTDS